MLEYPKDLDTQLNLIPFTMGGKDMGVNSKYDTMGNQQET